MDALTKWRETVATKAKPRLTFKQLTFVTLACAFTLGASGDGYY